MNQRLISEEYMQKIMRHNLSIPKSSQSEEQPVLPAHKNDQDLTYFSYQDRYLLKSKDPQKLVFCKDAKVSKQYANCLKKHFHRIFANPFDFFDLEGVMKIGSKQQRDEKQKQFYQKRKSQRRSTFFVKKDEEKKEEEIEKKEERKQGRISSLNVQRKKSTKKSVMGRPKSSKSSKGRKRSRSSKTLKINTQPIQVNLN